VCIKEFSQIPSLISILAFWGFEISSGFVSISPLVVSLEPFAKDLPLLDL